MIAGILCLTFAAAAGQAGKFPAFTAGRSDAVFDKSPPHSEPAEVKARIGVSKAPNAKAQAEQDAVFAGYDLSKEKFLVVVPKSYKHADKWGLFVYVNAGDDPGLRPEWDALLEKHKLLGVAAHRSGNTRNIFDRFRLAVDANFNMQQRFNIDPARVYISGFSGGGRTASMVAVAYADIFAGAIPFCGVNFYKETPADPGKLYPKGYVAAAEVLTIAKSTGRYVLVTGETDFNLKNTKSVYEHGFKKEGFKNVLLLEVPGMGHSPPPAEWLDKGLAFLK